MQNEITINDHFPEVKEENVKSAAKRRLEYSLVRDLQMQKDNEAIAKRLEKDRESPK
jgi:hypothetical protein